jgi:hypothetical protein
LISTRRVLDADNKSWSEKCESEVEWLDKPLWVEESVPLPFTQFIQLKPKIDDPSHVGFFYFSIILLPGEFLIDFEVTVYALAFQPIKESGFKVS